MRIGLSRIKNKQKQDVVGRRATLSNSSAAEADGPSLLQIVRGSDVARQYRARRYARPR